VAARQSNRQVNFKSNAQYLQGRWSISFIGWSILTPVSIFAFYIRGRVFLELSISDAIYFSLFINFVTSLTFYILSISLLRKRYESEQSLNKIFFAYSLIWLVYSINEIILSIFLLHKPLHIFTEIIASSVPTISGLILTNLAIGIIANAIKIRKMLVKEIENLSTEKTSITLSLSKEKEILVSTIESLFLKQLAVIKCNVQKINQNSTSIQVEKMAQQIEDYASNIVRKIAHEIDDGLEIKLPQEMVSSSIPLKSSPFSPYLSTKFFLLTELIAGGFLQAYRNGLPGIYLQVTLSLLSFTLAVLGSIILNLLSAEKIRLIFVAFYILLFYVIIERFLCLFQNVVYELRFTFSTEELAIRFTLALILTSGFISALKWIDNINTNLAKIRSLSLIDINMREDEILSTRSRISSALHGPIQGRLAGIAMALRFSESNSDSDKVDFEKIQEKVIPQLTYVSNDLAKIFEGRKLTNLGSSLENILINLVQEWENLIAIQFTIPPQLMSPQEKDLIRNVRDVCNEAITNSIRHGKATEIFIEFEKIDDEILLRITDNGRGVIKNYERGMGLDSIERISTFYRLENLKSGGSKLTATFSN
jgi:signal transduction histidine kinase